MLLELPTGGLSDTLGRKSVYMRSLVVKALACIVLLFAYDLLTTGGAVMLAPFPIRPHRYVPRARHCPVPQ